MSAQDMVPRGHVASIEVHSLIPSCESAAARFIAVRYIREFAYLRCARWNISLWAGAGAHVPFRVRVNLLVFILIIPFNFCANH